MINLIEKLDIKEWLKLNAQLQQKKMNLRIDLFNKGILPREGNNTFDEYKYFTEAQYKLLFTELFPRHGLELTMNELSYDTTKIICTVNRNYSVHINELEIAISGGYLRL